MDRVSQKEWRGKEADFFFLSLSLFSRWKWIQENIVRTTIMVITQVTWKKVFLYPRGSITYMIRYGYHRFFYTSLDWVFTKNFLLSPANHFRHETSCSCKKYLHGISSNQDGDTKLRKIISLLHSLSRLPFCSGLPSQFLVAKKLMCSTCCLICWSVRGVASGVKWSSSKLEWDGGDYQSGSCHFLVRRYFSKTW